LPSLTAADDVASVYELLGNPPFSFPSAPTYSTGS
jgi:hypothetical protein